MPCRDTQDGWVMLETSDETWSTGERNGKPLQHSCLENPVNIMKRQKDMIQKMNPPGNSVHASCFNTVRLFTTLCIVAQQAPLSMGFSMQEYWSGFPFPAAGDFPDPGIKPMSHVSCTGRWVLCQ